MAHLQTFPPGFQQELCFCMCGRVYDHIIRIALKLDVRMGPPHPLVERIMQEEIRQ